MFYFGQSVICSLFVQVNLLRGQDIKTSSKLLFSHIYGVLAKTSFDKYIYPHIHTMYVSICVQIHTYTHTYIYFLRIYHIHTHILFRLRFHSREMISNQRHLGSSVLTSVKWSFGLINIFLNTAILVEYMKWLPGLLVWGWTASECLAPALSHLNNVSDPEAKR